MGRGKQSFKVVEVDDLIVCTLGILMIKVLYKYSNRAILPCASQFSHKCNIFFSGTVLLFVIAFLAAGVCWAGFSCPLRTVRSSQTGNSDFFSRNCLFLYLIVLYLL